ncbi:MULTISPECIES: ZIP family metal transporter [Halomonas]|uniref:ZIP family zinc transporter n=1 Tax=Halomonas ventosae TaxID=229007 RepID=A0A4R6GN26_9GAMM|nr:divalent cation transporter [Halomonas ventosae]TDN96621.1 ZIP family zinc transporter [Halomonas ventosae]
MDTWQTVLTLTLMAGMAMPLGAWFSQVERIPIPWLETEFRHGVIAFGGGALLSAVALVLVPDSLPDLNPAAAAACFLAGGLAFMALDIVLNRRGTSASQLTAMLSDFVPEALALGAVFAQGSSGSLLLACLMALQNLPEGFNAYRELRDSTPYSSRRLIGMFFLMAWLGPLAGLSGFLWLAEFPLTIASLMLFASGGILYSVFQDLAPQARLDRHWGPPLGAVLGFALGIVGHMLIVKT